ncbi:Radical SAM domain protein [Solidesulfovibrio carbinoliphilus subsp. oakridgensis]|uniref:Radical SAM domain protein n=1 Tax=Solidesulfovibrio carbinoliphilus subsp. oakridgensis TaxID=694327 RepID=G7Q9I4_9BACT|nr:radical SAM (seleno)protein TrsS [Solidesulfovibrio carbinoliphilus]EHJ48624.1 Radical SAM domain protein [Solidesulfovibrio carbinoliphilus subsp. oakridgensis]
MNAQKPIPTASLCPICLRRVAARRETDGLDGYIVKDCPEHGEFRTRFWHGPPGIAGWNRPKVPGAPPPVLTESRLGCPHDCGLCPEHGQRTCTALFEVTGRCNLACPVCFARSGEAPAPDPTVGALADRFARIFAATGPVNVQLSGGEPTVRADLPAVVAACRAAGFAFVQVNTNGLALARDPGLARRLADAGLVSVFLQFDGTTDDVFATLRGAPLLAEKLAAIDRCVAAGLGVVLVPTIVPGVNDGQLGDIVRLARSRAPGVRGVHFQPASSFGRYPWESGAGERVTLPDLMRGLEAQTGGMIRAEDFHPPGCEHSLCSFSQPYLLDGEAGLVPAAGQAASCCSPAPAPIAADEGARRAKGFVARQWAAPTFPPKEGGPMDDFDRFLADAATSRRFTLSAMAFQDAWTLDLERTRGCCIHVATADNRLVPFCLYNLTATDGTTLHRGRPCA